jgi:hypothetical protein
MWNVHRAAAAAALFLAAAAAGCSRTAVVESKPAPPNDPAPIPHSREADDVGRFLAGLPGNPGSPFAELEDTPAWKDHRNVLDTAWKNADENLIQGLAEFQRDELNRPPVDRAPVFYPFSGPDTLTPLVCFPRAETYVLVALEPAGTLPSLKQIEKKKLPAYLGAVRKTMASILGKSFFVTREMDRQFRGQVTDGLLSPMLQLLVRTNHTVLGFRYVRLDESGRMVERPANFHTPGPIGNKGFEVEFRSDADQSIHRLTYLSVNVSDKRLRDDSAFLAYAATLKGSTTLLKATSYMTHKPEFSMIRLLVVKISGAVLQDDSGIPYRYFDSRVWTVQLYGGYQRPFGSFKWMEQKDLRAAYQQPGVRPLPMRIGYGFGKIASNMLLAVRRLRFN